MNGKNGLYLFIILSIALGIQSNLYSQTGNVKLKGHYNEPSSVLNENVIQLKGINKGEFLEIIIEGTIYDFEHLSLSFEGSGENFEIVEKEILNSLEVLSNRIIVIETYLPEGIPSERIKWRDGSGKVYEYDFHENGNGAVEYNYPIYDDDNGYWPLVELEYQNIKDVITESVFFPYIDSTIAEYIDKGSWGYHPTGFYPIGWSADGKFAYVIVKDFGEIGGLFPPIALYIIDSVTDEIIYKEEISDSIDFKMSLPESVSVELGSRLKSAGPGKEGDTVLMYKKTWELISEDYIEKLSKYRIIKTDIAEFNTFPITVEGEAFLSKLIVTEAENYDREAILSSYSIEVKKATNENKLIFSGKTAKDESVPVIGITIFGAFKSPFENRIAVLYGLWDRGWEGIPWLSLHLSGCHLDYGFK